jgi:hypothetical protein
VYWQWLNVRLSLRFGWTDMLKFRDHLLIGIVVALASEALSYIGNVAVPDGGRQVQASLTSKQGPLHAFVPPEISCVLRPLAGHEIGPIVTSFPGMPQVVFPEVDPVLAAGAYAVIWKERKPPGTGKQRMIAYYRCVVPPASQDRPAAGSDT